MATTNRFLGVTTDDAATATAKRQQLTADVLAQRRAFLASGEAIEPAIRAEIERQIRDLEARS